DGHADNPHLPNNYTPNTVVFTGTHDNTTTRAWFESLPENNRRMVWSYANRSGGAIDDITWEMIRLAWSSKAGLSIVPLQDVLNLGREGRMNLPGTAEGNWRWRCAERMLKDSAFERLRDLTLVSGRTASLRNAIQNETVQAA